VIELDSDKPRWVLHVDMDAFFAAVEQREHPDYRGKPVIVGADPQGGKGRGVVSTCSYEARKYGVHSAMPISRAYRMCPHGIYVPPNGRLYSQISQEVFLILNDFSDVVEPISIDEAFVDITGSLNLFPSVTALGKQLKSRIYDQHQLTASVGIAPNKFLAKIASDLKKPDGLVIVEHDKIDQFLEPLEVSRMWGAGKITLEKLHKYGIHTIGDMKKIPRETMQQVFGKLGEHFYRLSNGIDDRKVHSGHAVKSVSNEMTFHHDLNDQDVLYRTIFKLSEKVGYRLREKKLKGKTVHLKLRYAGFETLTRNKTLKFGTSNTEIINKVITELFDTHYQKGRQVRLIGVGVSGFVDEVGEQISLFEKKMRGNTQLDELEDLVKSRFGKHAIGRAEGLAHKNHD
jgi:nucleotidyltransferase/DNA polymerase involved in DNA repair